MDTIKPFKKLLLSIKYTKKERDGFVRMCSDWGLFTMKLSNLTKLELLKLLHYLVEERPTSNNILKRTIGRFNRVNALKKEDLV